MIFMALIISMESNARMFLKKNAVFCLLLFQGSVDVPVDSLEIGVEAEKWYPVTLESSKTNGEAPSIRLKFKYQVF